MEHGRVVLMLHIICEDDTAGFEFWNSVNDILLGGKAYMHKGTGINTIKSVLDRITNITSSTVLFAIDRIANQDVVDLLSHIAVDHIARQYIPLYSAYYCFEELFISFQRITDWGLCDRLETKAGIRFTDIAKFVQGHLYRAGIASNYYNPLDPMLISFITDHNPDIAGDLKQGKIVNPLTGAELLNREHFANQLLAAITKLSTHRFHIMKNKLGDCWHNDCSCYCSRNNGHFCDRCYIKDQPLTALEKMEILDAESLASKHGNIGLEQLSKYL